MLYPILVVDDEPSILFVLKALLSAHGYEVETAGSAKAALASLETRQFELVLTDMHMETETAGYEVIRAAAKIGTTAAILTAYPSACSDWQQQGAQALWEKPLSAQELLRRMQMLLARNDRQRLVQPAA